MNLSNEERESRLENSHKKKLFMFGFFHKNKAFINTVGKRKENKTKKKTKRK